MKLDRIDRQILTMLQHNARISNAELAQRVNLSQTPCLRRLRKLEESGLIRRYTAELDTGMLGLNIAALAFIKLEKNTTGNARTFEDSVLSFPMVTECCVLTGTHDYMLKVLARSLADYDRFVKEELAGVPHVADIETTIVLNEVRRAHGIPAAG